ncbi:MAG: hypothetical protein WD206_04890 [Actinomycetota bacterium]
MHTLDDDTARELELLEREAPVVVDRRNRRAIRVGGADAVAWLHDLLTADIQGLAPGATIRSLLLSPTGRIRGEVHVYRRPEDVVLSQDPAHGRPIEELLAPYVLSSDVVLEPAGVGVVCVLGPGEPAREHWRPSQLFATGRDGGDGADLLLAPDVPLPEGFATVGWQAVDLWRTRRGDVRFGLDLDEESLPAEAGLDDPEAGVIDGSKGCYLGQESVAKIRNFGHPRRVLVAADAAETVLAGTPIHAVADPTSAAGLVTSAAPRPGGGTRMIVRIRWADREKALTAAGKAITLV